MKTKLKAMKITITEFCAKHRACSEGREWAVKNCPSMDDVWAQARRDWLIWIATRIGVLNDRDLRLFAVFCARSCQPKKADPRSVAAIDCAERFARGEATAEELSAAESAARSAAESAARSVAESAARAAAGSAAWSAAESAARSAQVKWLRKNTIPNFDA